MNSPQPFNSPVDEIPLADGPAQPARRGKNDLYPSAPFFQKVPGWLWLFVAGGAFCGCFSANPKLTVGAIVMPALLCGLLWFEGEPPTLLFICVMQWVQASCAIFYCDLQGVAVSYNDLDLGGAKAEEAAWLSMAGVLVMATGMRRALGGWGSGPIQQARQEAGRIRIDRAFVLYLIAFVLSAGLSRIAPLFPRITQPLMAMAMARLAMVFLLAYAVIENRRGYPLLIVMVCVEVVVGFTGFFADFKEIFFVLLVVLSGAGAAIKRWRLLAGVAVTILLVFVGLFWTAIKRDYRDSVNEGTHQQEALVPFRQRLATVAELARSTGWTELKSAAEEMTLRLNACKYFALTIENVPAFVPYENGRLWRGAVKQTLMPRLLFPRKKEIHDSLETMYYTGVEVAGPEEGNSIGIGYCAESYVDFGPVGMFLPILLLGLYYGFIYRAFIQFSQRKIFGLSVAGSLIISCAFALEMTNNLLVGRVLADCLAMGLILAAVGNWIWEYLTCEDMADRLARREVRDRGA